MDEKVAVLTSRDWHGVVAAALLAERCQLPEKEIDLFFVPLFPRPRIELEEYGRVYITGAIVSVWDFKEFLRTRTGIVIGDQKVREMSIGVEITLTWNTQSPFSRCCFESRTTVEEVARILTEEKRWSNYAKMVKEKGATDLRFAQVTRELRRSGNILELARQPRSA